MSLSTRIRFDNKALRRLPIDPEQQNFTRQVAAACFSRVNPTPVKDPSLVAVSPVALELLGIPRRLAYLAAPASALAAEQQPEEDRKEAAQLAAELTRFLSGNELLPGSEPASHCYCGHQFGSFAGQLGDGAAIYLGESVHGDSDIAAAATRKATSLPFPGVSANARWEVQLKGAGPTPYSRSADGRKVLRSSLREFACSEIMYSLGIPTTRAGTLITSETTVRRDPLYTGREIDEKCSVVSRIAESFIRFGSFEICKESDSDTAREGPSADDPAPLRALFDYVAEELFTNLAADAKQSVATAMGGSESLPKAGGKDDTAAAPLQVNASGAFTEASWESHAAVAIFADIVRRTAMLVAKWQAFGWCHGVLNTDNMSIIGLTIDYGPYAFMTHYDEDFVCNLSDHSGRYSYKNQPEMCEWNLKRLAESWEIIFPQHKSKFDELIDTAYYSAFLNHYNGLMAAKIGFFSSDALSRGEIFAPTPEAAAALEGLLGAFRTTGADWTSTWRLISKLALENASDEAMLSASITIAHKMCCSPVDRQTILRRRMQHLRPQMSMEQIQQLMRLADVNPAALQQLFTGSVEPEALKVFLVEQAKMWEELGKVHSQLQDLKKYADAPNLKKEEDQAVWFDAIKQYKELLKRADIADAVRIPRQLAINPAFVLFPWVLQEAIDKAETGSYSLVRNVVDRSMAPFEDDPRDGVMWSMTAPEEAASYCVSCSS